MVLSEFQINNCLLFLLCYSYFLNQKKKEKRSKWESHRDFSMVDEKKKRIAIISPSISCFCFKIMCFCLIFFKDFHSRDQIVTSTVSKENVTQYVTLFKECNSLKDLKGKGFSLVNKVKWWICEGNSLNLAMRETFNNLKGYKSSWPKDSQFMCCPSNFCLRHPKGSMDCLCGQFGIYLCYLNILSFGSKGWKPDVGMQGLFS